MAPDVEELRIDEMTTTHGTDDPAWPAKPSASADTETGAAERFWNDHYRAHDQPWSRRANAVLTEVAATLPPGRALDLGCADGGDAIWLAQRGWQVTGVDVSATVLRRARVQVATAGLGDRVDFQRHDVSESLPDGTFDLIVASHFHSPIDFPRNQVFRSTAQMLSPHGVLLIVDHASTAPWSWNQDPDHRFPAPEETFAEIGLDPALWAAEILEARDREASGPNGITATVTDNVIMIRRVSNPSRESRD
jgi:SAM-dependent methyltransferase